jgi:hypothetical protein
MVRSMRSLGSYAMCVSGSRLVAAGSLSPESCMSVPVSAIPQ